MREISHDQAYQYLLAAVDGLLGDAERADLQHHLRSCPACRSESESFNSLQQDLRRVLHRHWDAIPQPVAPLVTELPPHEPLAPRLGRLSLNVLLLALWAWLYSAVFGYLRIIFSSEEFRTNQVVLIIVLALIFIQFRQPRQHPHWDVLPQIYWPGLALALGGSMLYLIVERFLDINTLSASIFGLATYGLLGLWISPRRWQDGLPAALLLIGTLPFGDHLQTFVGYPMRLATAAIVRDGLHVFGVQSVGVDTILILESGLAQVDLPCSGIKSLWTGLLFLIAATWIERRPIQGHWFGVVALTGVLLFIANVARVGTLVVVDQVAGWKLVAEMIHVPLGVLAFVGVCGAALWLLGGIKPSYQPVPVSTRPTMPATPTLAKRPLWLVPLLSMLIAAMALLYTPRPQTASAQEGIAWTFPADLQVTVSPLSPGLYAWATSGGADAVERWDFTWLAGAQPVNGSFLFLISDTWRAQHRPERCFEVEGLTVESSHTVMLADDFPVRMVEVSHGQTRASAFYWLQTGERVTDDFATRIWADLSPDRPQWVLVTILLDDVYSPDDVGVKSLLDALRASVANSMKEKPHE